MRYILSSLTILIFLFGCTNSTKVKTLRLGHGHEVSHPVHQAMLKFAKLIDEKSNGTMKVCIYPSSQLGKERELIEPFQFGIMVIMNLCIGLRTPPVGTILFVSCSVAKIGIGKIIKPLLPLFIAMNIVLMLVPFIPEINLWLPGVFGY